MLLPSVCNIIMTYGPVCLWAMKNHLALVLHRFCAFCLLHSSHITAGGNMWLVILGRFENTKKSNINLNQMGSNGTHKNKTNLSKEKNSKVHLKKSAAPLKVKN